jgi:hypothetical protein
MIIRLLTKKHNLDLLILNRNSTFINANIDTQFQSWRLKPFQIWRISILNQVEAKAKAKDKLPICSTQKYYSW